MIGGNSGKDLPSGTQYGTFFGTGVYDDDADAAQILAKGGTANNLYVRAAGAPGSGKSWTFTVFKNGSAQAALTCMISGDATSCSDTTGSVSFAAGDTISIRIAGAGNTAKKVGSWGLEFA